MFRHSFALLALLGCAPLAGATISVKASPEEIYIEPRTSQHLNFDFVVENSGTEAVELKRITLSVYDSKDRLVLRRFLSGNGFSPSIQTIFPDRKFEPKRKGMFFNPFHVIDQDVDLSRMRYDFEFASAKAESIEVTVDVRPRHYKPKSPLLLPLQGKLIIDDGGEFYGHHRRMNYTHPVAEVIGFSRNFMRYALDLMHVNEAGLTHQGKGEKNEQYIGWGKPVLAPAAGKVAGAWSEQKDNDIPGRENYFDEKLVPGNPMYLYGNYMVIDHGNGEFSLMGHLGQGSVTKKVGDVVAAGERIGTVGSSGSSIYPHLHFELRNSADLKTEGLPAYFVNYRKVLGSKSVAVKSAPINTGDIVEAVAKK